MMFLSLFTKEKKKRKKWLCVAVGHLGYNQLELSN